MSKENIVKKLEEHYEEVNRAHDEIVEELRKDASRLEKKLSTMEKEKRNAE